MREPALRDAILGKGHFAGGETLVTASGTSRRTFSLRAAEMSWLLVSLALLGATGAAVRALRGRG
jgi:hypothetical protein